MMAPWLLVVVLLTALGCGPAPVPLPSATPLPAPTLTLRPTNTAEPTEAASPSPSAVARAIDASSFTLQGGCGDAFLWATTRDGTSAITVEWQGAASEAWEKGGFDETASIPDERIVVALVSGRLLSTLYCDDVGMPDEGVDAQAFAVSGSVSMVVRPDLDAGFRPGGHADVILEDAEFEVNVGDVTELWRLDRLEWQDELIGWFAG